MSKVLLLSIAVAGACASACHKDGCVGGDDGSCVPPTACAALLYSCGDTGAALSVHQIEPAATPDGSAVAPHAPDRPPGPKALAANGDYLLSNGQVTVVIDAPEHQHHLAPSGGSVIDFLPSGAGNGDQTNAIYQAAGLLPRDAVHYESAKIDDQSGSVTAPYVAVILRGHLEGDRRVTVVTRYELRPCEPGLRVRSDLYNGAPDPNTLFLADGFFWGDQTLAPFVPGVGMGFRAPDLDLTDVSSAWREWPFMAARSQAAPYTSFAVVPCGGTTSAGFNTTTLSASGVPLATTQPGDGFHYDRFIIAKGGLGLSPAVADALLVRTMLHGEPLPVVVTGRVVANGSPFDGQSGRAASLLFYEPAFGPDPDDETRRHPWSEAVPGPGGMFSVALPPNRSYRVQPYAFGRPAGPASSFAVASAAGNVDIGDVTFTASAHLKATVNTAPGQQATFAELVLIPGDTPASPAPSLYGLFPGCDPMLGPPHGGSPACNRALTRDGTFDLLVPPGQYYVYATIGPFGTIYRQRITIGAGEEEHLNMQVQSLAAGLLPADVVSGDFHVHGAASYDSSIPDQDRVVSFLAAGVDVIVASDHDVVTTYQDTLSALDATNRLTVIPGVEQTPNILWFAVPGQEFPKTLGHFNFWPLAADTSLPRNGAPWDELREPGQMMDDMEPLFSSPGVRQLNHPYALTKLGRDQGFLRAIGYDPTKPIKAGAGFAADVLLHRPNGDQHHSNLDWDVEEVMTGASRRDWLRYRKLWFSLLSQGFLRAGAANSDTHTLALEQIGYPRNLIWSPGQTRPSTFDVEAFDADVRAGHMAGTNGPVLAVSIDDPDGTAHRPGIALPTDVVAPKPGAVLDIWVQAAPWIPFTEVRVFVNGHLVRVTEPFKPPLDPYVLTSDTFDPTDYFGTALRKAHVQIPLSVLTASVASGDAWLIVEAGYPAWTGETLDAPDPPDSDGDGLPDLDDADIPTRPPSAADPSFDLAAIAPGVSPTAFSNPFLLDLNGDGVWQAPGL